MKKIVLCYYITLMVFTICSGMTDAAEQMIDRVVAVVGDEIILLSDIQQKMQIVMINRKLDANSPPHVLRALQDDILKGEIDDRLLQTKAARDSLVADPRDVDRLLNEQMTGLKENLGSEEAFQNALQEIGFTERQLRYMYYGMAEKNVLQQMLLDNIRRVVSVTPQDLEAWYEAHKDSLPTLNEEFKVSHIMLVPKVSDDKKQEVIKKLEGIRQRILDGEDFAELAKQYSEDPVSAPDGGDIGLFPRGMMIKEFDDAAFSLKVGEISEVIETLYGLHIIRVDESKENKVKARHILLGLTPDDEDEKKTIERMKEIRGRIVSGEVSFEDMAREYSEDPQTKDLGGKMKWLTKDAIINVAGFQSLYDEISKLVKGGITEPFKSKFGYHIAMLDDYSPEHTLNLVNDRVIIENQLYQEKTIMELERVLARLRSETYIDIRME